MRLSQQLLALGADVTLRSRWTNMNALHYAAYFDVPDLVRVLLKGARPRGEEEELGWEGGRKQKAVLMGWGRRPRVRKVGKASDGAWPGR